MIIFVPFRMPFILNRIETFRKNWRKCIFEKIVVFVKFCHFILKEISRNRHSFRAEGGGIDIAIGDGICFPFQHSLKY